MLKENGKLEKQVAIVLGGTNPHISLIQNLKNRGYYTILVDYLENPPAKAFADEHLVISTLDHLYVKKIAEERKASLVISLCIDQANVTACYVSEKLGLSAPYSYKTSINVTNKKKMKETLLRNKIPSAKYQITSDLSEFNYKDFKYPLIIKPVDSNSSKGVQKIDNSDQLKNIFEKTKNYSREGSVVIEEFQKGKEIGVDCVIKDTEAYIIMTRERIKLSEEGVNGQQQIHGSIWPASISQEGILKLQSLAKKIADCFHLNNTPLMIQTIFFDDTFNVIEFAARIGGGENYNIIKRHTGFDMINAGIESFLHNSIDLFYDQPNGFYGDLYLYVSSCILGKIIGLKTLKDKGIIEDFHIFKNIGDEIGSELSSNNRIGSLIVKASSKDLVFERLIKAVEAIQIFDSKGNNVFLKDLYDFK